ncbi:MAG: glycosyltransferase, partial [Candidatus Omnitrophica bacterium]|nr:glycosyltransferase [Candidatus Omnitrophota bacterium]
MKILFVAHSFVPHTFAGTEVYAYTLSKELVKKNEVFVFFRVKNPTQKEYAITEGSCDGFKTFAINHTFNQCRSFEETYQDYRIDEAFGRVLDFVQPDCVHIQHLLFLSLGIVKEAKKRDIPVVFTLNDYWLICQRGQFIRDDFGVCQRYDAARCKQCLLSQLSIKGNAMYFYNILRKTVPNVVLRLIKKAYIKTITSSKAQDEHLDSLLRKREEMVRETIANTDIFISPSHFMRQKFIEYGVPEQKIIHLSHGYAHPPILQEKFSLSLLRFGFIGTLLPMKGVDV